MMSDDQNSYHQPRGFWTPQDTWKSSRKSEYPPRPLSEGNKKEEIFHVIHKVPIGDSPYVKAKHVQLIEKDPSRAISLFWAAINSGDRVDSALKDMAAVMKQLNRSDEAIEAVKSFRHLCPYDAQESIDNVLVELYKRSGRVEEEIELLELKLKKIEANMAGGRRTKNARCQGKKVQITLEQDRSRVLGNLAWAYLQLEKFEIAERHYRKAMILEPDRNKQCNLALCLMKMNRVIEAKSLLLGVKASCGNRPMDESYAKSYERAFQMLGEHMARSELNPSRRNENGTLLGAKPFSNSSRRSSVNGGQQEDYILLTQPKTLGNGAWRPSWRVDEFSQSNENFANRLEEETWRKPINVVDHHTELDKKKSAADYLTESNRPNPEIRKKSWADMAEEEEDEEEYENENLDPKDDFNSTAASYGNRSAKRSLCFDQQRETDNNASYPDPTRLLANLRRGNRLPVFHDITSFPDSP